MPETKEEKHVSSEPPLGFSAITLLSSSVVRVGACLYIPALPAIGAGLGVDDSKMSATLTAYFLFFAISSLVMGPIADAAGRRRIVLAGAAVFAAGSMACALAGSYEWLIVGRCVQAVGAGMLPGPIRAMIRDACSGKRVVSLMGWMAVLGGATLVGAPIIGGFLTETMGWRSNFHLLTAFTAIVFLAMLKGIPETLPPEKRVELTFANAFGSYFQMLRSPAFSLVMAPVAACFAIQGAYLATASFVFIKEFSMTPSWFGLSNIAIVAALFAGRFISVKMARRSISLAFMTGAGIMLLCAVAFAALPYLGALSGPATTLTTISIFALGFGTLSPIGLKSSITAFRSTGGAAAALQGAFALGGAAVGGAIAGALMASFPNATPLSILSWTSAPLAALSAAAAIPARSKLH